MSATNFAGDDTIAVPAQDSGELHFTAKEEELERLIQIYNNAIHDDKAQAQELRQVFLRLIEHEPAMLSQEKFAQFLAEQIEFEDFTSFDWETPEAVAVFCETLYNVQFSNKSTAEHMHTSIHRLLRHALRRYEEQNAYEKMFQLLRLTPHSFAATDMEFNRLRGLAYRHEMRRVKRNRRLLFVYLIAHFLLVMVVFPFLFINAENGRLQREVEETVEDVTGADVTKAEGGRQFLTYSDGLYWAFITAGSIGYGDVTPKTQTGRVIASVLGFLGVITVGVIAGLILEWITVRRLS